MIQPVGPEFDPVSYLAHSGPGRRIVQLEPKQSLFSQGDLADAIFYLQSGQAKVTVVSKSGEEATITILAAGDFAGEESLTAARGLRLAMATLPQPAAHSGSIERR
jgi:CRP/FNR family transcriptional regulator, cyclic AMP receptor protein